ncbi:MAG: hypothetical protein DWQ04_06735 [Chloroflexi bacterium]|nr:MAG: hypothetical protein DWQ04_06735 [Chloroflexota bacterium]
MTDTPSFAEVLNQFLHNKRLSVRNVADLSQVPRRTIENWTSGGVVRPRDWQGIVKVAQALNLTSLEVNQLLQAAGHLSLKVLLMQVEDSDEVALLSPWNKQIETAELSDRLSKVEQRLHQLSQPDSKVSADDVNGRLPPPGSIPTGSYLPLPPNPLFIGREEAVQFLADALDMTQEKRGGQIAAVTGMGGLGKTQLAVEVAHQYGRYFHGGVFWLNFTEADTISRQVANCGGIEGMALSPDFADNSLEEQVSLVQNAWREPTPRLLIFDNCEDEQLLAQWRPTYGGCRILITSRRSVWEPTLGVSQLTLPVLQRTHSVHLLRQFRADFTVAEADLIAAEVGDLPLALRVAGSYLQRHRHEMSVAEYVAELRKWPGETILDHPSLRGLGVSVSPTGHDLHVARTFAISYARLNPDESGDALAIKLLTHMACFVPTQPIPRLLLRESLAAESVDALLFSDAMHQLHQIGLVHPALDGDVQIHSLIAQYAQSVGDLDGAETAVSESLAKQTRELLHVEDFSALRRYQIHLRVLTDRVLNREDVTAARLADCYAWYLDLIGEYRRAESYHLRALAIRRHLLGDSHDETGASWNNLGMVYLGLGEVDKALTHVERGLQVRQAALGETDKVVAESLTNMGLVYQDKGANAQARAYYEQAIAIWESDPQTKAVDLASGLSNLGYFLFTLGNYEEAYLYQQRALNLRQQVLSTNHSDLGLSFNNLGALLYRMGDTPQAIAYLKQALSIWEHVCGSEHPNTGHVLNNIGKLLTDINELDDALPYLSRSMAIRQQLKAPVFIAQSFNNMGAWHQKMAQWQQARHNYEQALAIRKEDLGDAHPETIAVSQSLSEVIVSMSDQKSSP